MDNGMDAIFGQPEVEQPREETAAPETVEQPQAEAQEAQTQRQRDEATGKFVKAPGEAEKAPSDEPPAKPQAPLSEKETVGFYKAMQEERDKRQAAEKRASDYERQIADLKAKAPPETVTAEQRLEEQIQRLQDNQNRMEAHAVYGAEKVKTSYDWAVKRCDEDPVFNTRAMSLIQSNGNPYEVAVALRKEADDLDALKTGKAPAAPETPPIAPVDTPAPRSLANAPGNGNAGQPAIPPSGFDAVFNS